MGCERPSALRIVVEDGFRSVSEDNVEDSEGIQGQLGAYIGTNLRPSVADFPVSVRLGRSFLRLGHFRGLLGKCLQEFNVDIQKCAHHHSVSAIFGTRAKLKSHS